MRGLLLAPLAALTLAAVLACGGAWNEALRDTTIKGANEMRGEAVSLPDSPEKQRLMAIFDGMQQNPEAFGVVELATIQAAFQTAMGDGKVTSDEVDEIEQAYQDALAE
jgi:hypothetical protein